MADAPPGRTEDGESGMALAGRPIDVLVFIEHAARELDIACVVARAMARRHGLAVCIASINWDLATTLKRYEPRVVAVPYCYSAQPEDPGVYEMVRRWPRAVLVNLTYEQFHPNVTRQFNMPRDVVARSHVLHHAWGAFHAEALQGSGVPSEHIMVNGNPVYALYGLPYQRFYEPREKLAARHRLDPRKRWVFIPESYGAAFRTDQEIKDLIRRGHDGEAAIRHRDFTRTSLRFAVAWWQEAAEQGVAEMIVRPRPWTPLETFRRACVQTAGQLLSAHVHVIKEGTVREWVLASDVTVSNGSTTLIEAAMADKSVAMLAPQPFPALLRADWYDAVPTIDRKAAFMECAARSSWDHAPGRLKAWALERMPTREDPIARLADLLASVAKRERPVPPAVDLARHYPASRRAMASLRRRWRSRAQQRLHEQDRLVPAVLRERSDRWEAVLGEESTQRSQEANAHPRLSVVICTWNPSAEGLGRALESLERQSLESSAYEVLVVDNGSIQRGRAMVAARAEHTSLRLRYVHEPTLGASAARNRGVLESRGEVVAFLDDDARADVRWASFILQAYAELPDADCVGGRILLDGCGPAPSWWRASFNEACGELDYGPRRVRVGYPRYPYAGNLSFRRSVFAKVGYFSPALGPVGRRHLDGEEFEQCLRIERAGGEIFFDPALVVTHVVSHDRLSRRFVMHKGFYHGRSMALIEAGSFGRRFALWRSIPVRRDLVRRRHVALGRGEDGNGVAGSVDDWLVLRARQEERLGANIKLLAQGLGYGYQTLVHELWRRQRGWS